MHTIFWTAVALCVLATLHVVVEEVGGFPAPWPSLSQPDLGQVKQAVAAVNDRHKRAVDDASVEPGIPPVPDAESGCRGTIGDLRVLTHGCCGTSLMALSDDRQSDGQWSQRDICIHTSAAARTTLKACALYVHGQDFDDLVTFATCLMHLDFQEQIATVL